MGDATKPSKEGTPSSDEAIGRPPAWREGRYQGPGAPLDEAASKRLPTEQERRRGADTPVTRKDYESDHR
jgi:hypothetical protein